MNFTPSKTDRADNCRKMAEMLNSHVRQFTAAPSASAIFEGKPGAARNISGNSEIGWHLAMRYDKKLQVASWTAKGPVTMRELTGWSTPPVGAFIQGLSGADNRLVFGGLGYSSAGPFSFGEFDIDTGRLIKLSAVGTAESFYATCTESTQGLVGVIFDNSDSDKVVFHAFQRFIKEGRSGWWSQPYKFPAQGTGFGQSYHLTSCIGPDGYLWVFYTNDGGKRIGLIRFYIMHDYLCLASFDDNWLPSGMAYVSCSGENPPISATFEAEKNRILLAYQCHPSQPHDCPGTTLAYKWLVTSVTIENSWLIKYEPLFVLPWMCRQEDYPIPTLFPRTEGIHYFLREQQQSNCEYRWNTGVEVNGTIHQGPAYPNGKVISTSPDGFLLLYDRGLHKSSIVRFPFQPVFNVMWEHAPGDVLQASTDLITWTTIAYTRPPVTFVQSDGYKFFKVLTPA